MPSSRSVFYGFGGWVGQQLGLTQTAWWPNDPATMNPPFDTTKLITSDLAKNPQAVRNGQLQVAAIEIDDAPTHGGPTKLGPTWPTGSTLNATWMESAKYNALPVGVKPPRINYGMQ